MLTYTYNAADLCEPCGDRVKADPEVIASRDATFPAYNPDDLYSWDSDVYPKGPDEAGESDTPQHCDSCGLFLENPLTAEGVEYVHDILVMANEHRDLWGASDEEGERACDTWADFYADALSN